MNDLVTSVRNGLIVLLMIAAGSGCNNSGSPATDTSPHRAGTSEAQRESPPFDESEILRAREDLSRNRLWVLTLKEVRVYNTAANARKRLIWKIALPTWSVVGFRNVCMPDLALDRAGSAFISSNGQARLLRIDADRFELTDFAISFKDRVGLDSGFGALAFAADGALYGRTTPGGLLWRIDIARAHATMVAADKLPPPDSCTITTQSITTQLLNDLARN